jgi:hypothetical protein
MATRKWLIAAAAVATLAGCASDPYYDGYYSGSYAYRDYPSYRYYSYNNPDYYYYRPGYYTSPGVTFGLSYYRGWHG